MSKEKRLTVIALLVLMVATVSIPEASATMPDIRVRIEPAKLTVSFDETFVVQVEIEGAEDVAAFQFDLIYRPSILQVIEATVGEFLGSTGRSVMPIGPTMDNEQGRVSLGAVSFGDATGPSGKGVLASITCVARGEGSSFLQLQNVQVLDSQADPQSVTMENGQVEVEGAATPTPVATATPSATIRASPAPTATPRPTSTPAATITFTSTATLPASPTATVTRVSLPSPTPSPTSPMEETPTSTPPPSPTPSTAATEIRPTETPTPPTEATEMPIPVTQTPTLQAARQGEASPLPSPTSTPSTTPMPSPTLAATLTTPMTKESWNWIVPIGLLTGLGLIILGIIVLRVKRQTSSVKREDDK